MSIDFEAPKPIVQTQFVLKTVAEEMMRSRSRYFDEHEHEIRHRPSRESCIHSFAVALNFLSALRAKPFKQSKVRIELGANN